MALDEAEKLNCKTLLGIPANARYDFKGNDPETLLQGLSAAQQAQVRAILAAWDPIRFDRDRLKAEGLDSDPARTEAGLRKQLALVIGFRGLGRRAPRVVRG